MSEPATVVAICALNDIPDGEMIGHGLPNGTRIALYRLHGQVYATDDTCTHGQASLSEDGLLHGDEVECSWHGGRFKVASGEACASPCRDPLRTYPVTIVDNVVCVEC